MSDNNEKLPEQGIDSACEDNNSNVINFLRAKVGQIRRGEVQMTPSLSKFIDEEFSREMEEMANDPDILRENKIFIEMFEQTNMDGLKNENY